MKEVYNVQKLNIGSKRLTDQTKTLKYNVAKNQKRKCCRYTRTQGIPYEGGKDSQQLKLNGNSNNSPGFNLRRHFTFTRTLSLFPKTVLNWLAPEKKPVPGRRLTSKTHATSTLTFAHDMVTCTCQQIPCFDSYQLIIAWMSNSISFPSEWKKYLW